MTVAPRQDGGAAGRGEPTEVASPPIRIAGASSFRYGASFFDHATRLRVEAHHPQSRPDRWAAYLEGMSRAFARHGVETTADRHTLAGYRDVALFFVAVDDRGEVVAGVRCHGPLDDAHAAQALGEMAGSSEIDVHRSAVGGKGPFGVLEIKGGWRADGHKGFYDLIARCSLVAAEWLGGELTLVTLDDRWAPLLEAYGGILMGTEAVPFPSDRYRTVLVGLHRSRYERLLDPDRARVVREDFEQLRHQPSEESLGWRPVVLDVTRRVDRQVIAGLRADDCVQTLDLVNRQRAELGKLLPPAAQELADEQPRYVYFPWRRALVHMLGPRSFDAVRLDRNRNRVTRAEQARLRRQRVGVVGLSVGYSAAAAIALEGGCGEMRLADFDHIELTNLNRVPATVLDVGVNKAVVAARRLAEIDPYLPVQVVPDGLTGENIDAFIGGLDVVVEECDSIDMKLLVREVARRQRVAVVMDTSDRGVLDVERFDLEPDRRIFHGMLEGVSSSTVRSLSTYDKVPYVLRIIDANEISAKLAASLAEVDRTLTTWPQLGADVTLGGASVATAVRRIGLGEPVPSGRVRVDLDAAIDAIENPEVPPPPDPSVLPLPPRPADPLLVVCHAASLAPSGGNVQPWRFELATDSLSFELDRSKTSGMDVRFRGSYVALGAALFNARVAAASVGLLGPVRHFPEGPSSDVVASLAFGTGADQDLAALYPAMLERCSNRRHGTPAPLDLSLAAELGRQVAAEGCRLHLLTDRVRLEEYAEILAQSDRIRYLTPRLHDELISELRWPGQDATTGIDVRTLELPPSDLAALDVIRRSDVVGLLEKWDAGDALGDNSRKAVRSSSALAIVTVDESTPTSYLRGGAAVERLWITAQSAGLGVQPVSPVFVFAVQHADFDSLGGERWGSALFDLSLRFRTDVGLDPKTALVLVLRLSHAPPPSVRSTRLPLEAVMRRRGETR